MEKVSEVKKSPARAWRGLSGPNFAIVGDNETGQFAPELKKA